MPILTVRAKPAIGRSRAGKRFTREPSMVDVTDADAEAIAADPLLVIEEDSRPAPAPAVEPQPEPVAVIAPKRK